MHGADECCRISAIVNHEYGLLRVSGISSDLRDLCVRDAVDERPAGAVDLFCYQARKWIVSFAAVLGEIERSAQGRVQVRVIRTNQELMIARSVTGPLNSAETLNRIEGSRNVTQATAVTPAPGKTKCGTRMRVRSSFPGTSLDRLAGERGRENRPAMKGAKVTGYGSSDGSTSSEGRSMPRCRSYIRPRLP
jgi:hypothetical protein